MRSFPSAVMAAIVLAGTHTIAAAHDGDFDTNFQDGGGLRFALANQNPIYVDVKGVRALGQADGSIVLATSESTGPSINAGIHVVRLHADGSHDNGFGTNGETVIDFDLVASGTDNVGDIALQPDGQILVAGTTQGDNATTGSECVLARLQTNGMPDPQFSSDGKTTFGFNAGPSGHHGDICLALAVQHDGAIVVAGGAEKDASGNYTMAVARFNTDGTPDTSFGPGQVNNKRVLDLTPLVTVSNTTKVLELSNHQLLLIGIGLIASGGPSGSQEVWTLVRLNADGSTDTNYGFNGVQVYAFQSGGADQDVPYDAVLLADDSVVVVGQTAVVGNPNSDVAIAKFNATGALDTTWGNQGRQIIPFDLGGGNYDTARGIALDAQGRFVISGAAAVAANNEDMFAVRLLGNGHFDPSFGTNGKRVLELSMSPQPDYDEGATAVVLAPDDAIIVAGIADSDGSGNYGLGVARLIGDTVFANNFGN